MPSMSNRSLPRVSVIIPTYNRAGYLREALDSVVSQSLVPEEIIVVDDGSTDDTPDVVEVYRPRVSYVRHHQNRGIAPARNSGLNAANGDVIAWLDSDDLWEPDFLMTVVSLLSEDETLDGAYTGITMINKEGTSLGVSTRTESLNDLYDALVRDCFLATPAVVARQICYEQVGGFDPQFRISEDYDMWLRLSKRFRLVGIPLPLVRIRVHPSNTMADTDTLCKARLTLTQKHFGQLGESARDLTGASRAAYGYAFRSIGLKYIESGQPSKGWRFLEQAAELHPEILERTDTFYELVCADQSRGYRGRAEMLDIPANGAEMLQRLDTLFAKTPKPVRDLRRVAYGNAYVVLAMLSDQAGHWDDARRYILQAFKANPRLIGSWSLIRRWLKLCSGQKLVNAARTLYARD